MLEYQRSMFLILIFVLFLESSMGSDGKIVNGSVALAGEFPFMVSLRRASSGRHSCGASLLNRVWVLTAAHCVVKAKPNQINVQYGSIELDQNSTNVANVSKIFVHEGYEPANQYIHDIALLRLDTPANVEKDFFGIRLPEQNASTDNNTSVTLIGWGLNEVSLRLTSTKRHFCAGTIVKSNFILTSAHCFTYVKRAEDFLVQYNSSQLNPIHPQYAAVLEIIIHEGYNPTIAIHDIALCRLKDSMNMDMHLSEIVIASYEDRIYENIRGILLGWGLNGTDGILANQLEKVSLEIITLNECRKRLNSFIHNSNICVEGLQIGQCSGDSGGPLVYEKMQIGLVSWSLKPCASKPGVFTNLSYYSKWLKEKLGQ